MNPNKELRALVCPLDWGLGHASRCIPVIRELLLQGFRVTIAASGQSLLMLRNEFPNLPFTELKGFSPGYSGIVGMTIRMLMQVPAFIYYLIAENRSLSRLIKIQKFDLIISDNRYGIFHPSAYNILIIHQIRIRAPKKLKWIEPLLFLVNRKLISRFDACWIPDFPGKTNLGGALSHPDKLPGNAEYIGPLSRYRENHPHPIRKSDLLLAVLSGPEPQRTLLEQKILQQFGDLSYQCVLIRGVPDSTGKIHTQKGIEVIPYASGEELRQYLQSAALVVCRSGYSTIMDLAAFGAKALFIPTPGQTEQEYLAEKFRNDNIAHFVLQDKLDLRNDIRIAEGFKGFGASPSGSFLHDKIASLKSILTQGQ